MDKINVLVIYPNKNPELRCIDNELEPLQEIVGGHIEAVTISESTVIICNEEGRLLNLPYNFSMTVFGRVYDFVGPIIICGYEGDELTDCPEPVRQRIEKLKRIADVNRKAVTE